jgi:outer membrane protein
MKTPRLVLITALVASAYAPAVFAQNLSQLYEAARAYDATYQSAKSLYEANLYKAEQARAGVLPTANLSAGVSRTQFTIDTPKRDTYFGSQNASVGATMPLYRPANWATYDQGLKQIDAAQTVLSAAEQDLIVRVSQAYFDVLASQDSLAFVKPKKRRWPSNWPRPSATLKSAPPPSPTPARPKPALTW